MNYDNGKINNIQSKNTSISNKTSVLNDTGTCIYKTKIYFVYKPKIIFIYMYISHLLTNQNLKKKIPGKIFQQEAHGP